MSSSSSHDLLISLALPVEPDVTVSWDQFLSDYDKYLDPESPSISFTVTFIGARSGKHRMRVDGLIRRFLDALGIDRRVVVGSYSARHTRSM